MTGVFILLSLVFWISALALAHTYVIYPLAMRILARKRRLPSSTAGSDGENATPPVVVFMAVYNEEAVLEETLRSIGGNDYPADKLEIVIGSDGSTDRSHEIVRDFQERHPDRAIHLEVFGGRNGKIRIINRLVEQVKERRPDWREAAFVLCDANVTWSRTLVRHLVRHFREDRVGLVATNVLDKRSRHEGIGAAEDAYVSGENGTKFAEGVLWGRVMGAFGACYAIRGSLFQPVPEHHIVDDFYLTMMCFVQGRDAVMEPGATCYEPVSQDISEEFRRKRRISTGNFQNLAHFRSFLRPWRCGWPTWFAFWSHKGLRWTGPLLLAAWSVSTAALSFLHPFYLLPTAGLAAGVAGAVMDEIAHRRGLRFSWKPLRFLRYFLLMNVALFLGMVSFLRGSTNSIWEPTRRPGAGETPALRVRS